MGQTPQSTKQISWLDKLDIWSAYLGCQLWKPMRWIWGGLILGVFLNFLPTILTSATLNIQGTPIEWFLGHPLLSIPLLLLLLMLIIYAEVTHKNLALQTRTFGKLLEDARQSKGWGRDRLERAVNDIPKTSKTSNIIEAWEKGQSKPTREQRKKIAKLLNIPEGQLIPISPLVNQSLLNNIHKDFPLKISIRAFPPICLILAIMSIIAPFFIPVPPPAPQAPPFIYPITLSQTPNSTPPRSWPLIYTDGGPKDQIEAIQYLLKAHDNPGTSDPYNLGPYDNGGVDGYGGPMTEQATKVFQQNNHLHATGLVEPLTWEKLIKVSSKGDEGEQVKALQELLKIRIGFKHPVDGKFDQDTETGIKTFQMQKMGKQFVTGKADLNTWCVLVGGQLKALPIKLSNPPQAALNAKQNMGENRQLISPNGQFTFTLQEDGNLVERDTNGQVLWASCTDQTSVYLWNQEDGNIVIIAPKNIAIWAQDTTAGDKDTVLKVFNDGNIVVTAALVQNTCISCQPGWRRLKHN